MSGRSLWVFRQLAVVHCLRSISIHLLFPPISLLTRFTQSFFSSRPPQIGHLGSSLLFTKNMLLFVVLYCVVCYDYHGVKPWIPKRRLPCQGRGSPGSPFFLSLNDILYGSRVTRNEISSWSYWVSSYKNNIGVFFINPFQGFSDVFCYHPVWLIFIVIY